MMAAVPYIQRRGELETYFDRTALEAWARLTSDAPVGSIRATVRAGRDRMRSTLLSWLPDDLAGCRLLDAGCGTGSLSVEAARRGAEVIAVDLSPKLLDLARSRVPAGLAGRITFQSGDMLDDQLGRFDHVVAMDSLIHYPAPEMARAVAELVSRTRRSLAFTFAPRTPMLSAMHAAGRLFPRAERAPAIEPVSPRRIAHLLGGTPDAAGWRAGRSLRVKSSFYISEAMEIVRQ
nr:magnesium protoporphyrin IX methyltransferase [uncultured Lichenicoccus sp.]